MGQDAPFEETDRPLLGGDDRRAAKFPKAKKLEAILRHEMPENPDHHSAHLDAEDGEATERQRR